MENESFKNLLNVNRRTFLSRLSIGVGSMALGSLLAPDLLRGRNDDEDALPTGVKPGIVHGETDAFGYNIVKDPVHVHDFQATLLHLLGYDHEKFVFKHLGRRYRLTDVSGKVVKPILA